MVFDESLKITELNRTEILSDMPDELTLVYFNLKDEVGEYMGDGDRADLSCYRK